MVCVPRLLYLKCTDLDTRAISQDPSIYPDPTEFRPERFLGENPQLDPREYAFGGGRRYANYFPYNMEEVNVLTHRKCPGLDLADTILFFTLAMVLAVYDIAPLPESPPTGEYTDKFSR